MDILKSHAVLTAEQIAYLDKYTIEMEIGSEPIEYNLPADESQSNEEVDRKSENAVHEGDEMAVAGQTTFADLLNWGIPVEQIEAIIGGEIPNRLLLR